MCLHEGRQRIAQASASLCPPVSAGHFTCLSLTGSPFPWRMPSEQPEDMGRAGRHWLGTTWLGGGVG